MRFALFLTLGALSSGCNFVPIVDTARDGFECDVSGMERAAFSISLSADRAHVWQDGDGDAIEVSSPRDLPLQVCGLPAGVEAEVTEADGQHTIRFRAGSVAFIRGVDLAILQRDEEAGEYASVALSMTVTGRPGAFDTSFGTGGTITPGPNATSWVMAVRKIEDSIFVVGGTYGTSASCGASLFIEKRDNHGTLDPSFGEDGTFMACADVPATGVGVTEERLLVFSRQGPYTVVHAVDARTGVLVESFAENGALMLAQDGYFFDVFADAYPTYGGFVFLEHSQVLATSDGVGSLVTILDDGTMSRRALPWESFLLDRYGQAGFLISGYPSSEVGWTFHAVDADGNDDLTFGDAGCISGLRVIPMADGKLLVVERTGSVGSLTWHLARYDASGRLDPAFGDAGRIDTTGTELGGELITLFATPEGFLAADPTYVPGGSVWIRRYDANASPIPSIQPIEIPIGDFNEAVVDVVDDEGRLLFGGSGDATRYVKRVW